MRRKPIVKHTRYSNPFRHTLCPKVLVKELKNTTMGIAYNPTFFTAAITFSHVLRSRRSELSSPSFFVPYVVFAFNFFLFSVRPPKKSVNLTVNLLLLLFHPHPHPRLLLFVPYYAYVYYTYVSVMMQLQVTLRRQRILVGAGHPVGDFSGRYRYCSGRVGKFSLPVGTSYLLL